jgi:hypothetical protein
MSGGNANAASDPPPADTRGCNTATGDIGGRRTVRSLSANSDAAAAPDKNLARNKIVDHDQLDPRER